jgi:lipid-binding SYLF domain-containing protein
MANKPFHYLARGFCALLLFVAAQGVALAQSDQQKLVNNAEKTLSNFLRDPDMTWLQQHLKEAKGVIIAPEVLKAGFIFGGSGGRAVTLARDPKTGRWVGPAFYTLATASVGFQAGIQVSEIVTLVMTALLADFISFARAKGVYGGVNLDGSVVTVSNDWNEAYYHKQGILPPDILVRNSAHNNGAAKLLADVARAGK